VFTIKSNHELSEADYDMIFEWAISIVKSMIKPLGLGYKKVNMCLNFCIFYCLENAELTKYRTCEHAHYKLIIGREMTLATYRKLGYFPITHRLQRLFMSPKPIEQWHDIIHMMRWMESWCTHPMVKPENILIRCIIRF